MQLKSTSQTRHTKYIQYQGPNARPHKFPAPSSVPVISCDCKIRSLLYMTWPSQLIYQLTWVVSLSYQ